MDIGELLEKSWKDYKLSFKIFLKAYFWFHILPYLIVGLLILVIGWPFISSMITDIQTLEANIAAMQQNPAFQGMEMQDVTETGFGGGLGSLFGITGKAVSDSLGPEFNSIMNYVIIIFIVVFLVGIIMAIFGLFLYLTIYFASLYNEKGKMTFSQAARGGIKYFWKFIGLTLYIILIILLIYLPATLSMLLAILTFATGIIALGILFVLLSVGLFIGGLILTVYLTISWAFSLFVIIRENTGIREAMRRSRLIIKGRWWKVLGYMIVISLIAMLINLGVSVPAYVINRIFSIIYANSVVIYFIIEQIVSQIFGIIGAIVSVPLTVLYLKNFYLDLRTNMKQVG